MPRTVATRRRLGAVFSVIIGPPPPNPTEQATCPLSKIVSIVGRRSSGRGINVADGLRPELARGEASALGEARELRPHDARVDGGLADPRAVPAVGAGDDVLAADQLGVAA